MIFINDFIDRQFGYYEESLFNEKHDFHKFYFIIGLIGANNQDLRLNDSEIQLRQKLFRNINKKHFEEALRQFNRNEKGWQKKTKIYYSKLIQKDLILMNNLVDEARTRIISPFRKIKKQEDDYVVIDKRAGEDVVIDYV